MPDEIHFDDRMSDADALLWNMEADPLLRSTIAVVWILDGPPDRARLDEKIERATRTIPRLRQRVVSNPLSIAPPRWELDPEFDLSFHLRRTGAPGAGTLRDLLDLAQPIAMQGFDRARPLWELWIVEGLEGDRAGMILKLHHAVSDGVGMVRMTTSLVERYRWPDPARTVRPMPPVPEPHLPGAWERVRDALGHEQRRQLGLAGRTLRALGSGLGGGLRDPAGTAGRLGETLASVGRMLRPVTEPMSPLMRGRSLSLRFDTLRLPFEETRAAAHRVGGTINDAFVAGVCGGLRLYHQTHGAPIDTLRMTMPINVREGEKGQAAGNQFVPARFAVPVSIADPTERMRAIRELVAQQRREPALPLVEEVSGVLNRLPVALSTALFGSMLKGIDFVTSNVPGPRFEVFASGARIEAIYGFGPLSGAAANVTLFSYREELGIAISTDPTAVPDPEVFVECLDKGLDEVLTTT